ncbi:MAG: cupin domain-containing protein [Chloroflexota bacterium]|nr:cupin domain-containing protein [Chloroflexota bacterium]
MYQPSNLSAPPLGNRSTDPDAIAPDGSEIRLLIDHRHAAVGASMVEVTLPAGQVSRPVFHRTVEEVWYILQGNGQVWRCPTGIEEPSLVSAISVEPGDALVIPTGWMFQFSANESGSLRFLCVTMPPWPGDDEAQPASVGGLGPPTV